MPRYFFDVQDGVALRDETGREVSDADAARRVAVGIASGFAADPQRLIDEGVIVVSVRDATGAVVASVRLACLVDAA